LVEVGYVVKVWRGRGIAGGVRWLAALAGVALAAGCGDLSDFHDPVTLDTTLRVTMTFVADGKTYEGSTVQKVKCRGGWQGSARALNAGGCHTHGDVPVVEVAPGKAIFMVYGPVFYWGFMSRGPDLGGGKREMLADTSMGDGLGLMTFDNLLDPKSARWITRENLQAFFETSRPVEFYMTKEELPNTVEATTDLVVRYIPWIADLESSENLERSGIAGTWGQYTTASSFLSDYEFRPR
jgi:hypothetical protein